MPVTGREGPLDCETSRLPHLLDNRLAHGGKVRREGSGQLKNPIISSGIEFATFWLVAQCLDQGRYRVPLQRFPQETTNT
jgi:hypothetical protein